MLVWLGLALLMGLVGAVATFATQRVPPWDFARSSVLLTGGSTGIGLEIAKALVRRRVRHIVLAARREATLREATTTLKALTARLGSPTRVAYVVMDVGDEASVQAGMARACALINDGSSGSRNDSKHNSDGDGASEVAEDAAGSNYFDLVICNAGFAHPARFLDCTARHATSLVQTNLFGCLYVLWATMPAMLRAGRGRVVLTSSLVARAPIAGYTLYAATKAGLRAFAHSLDMENSCLGVRVQVVSPPDVQTPGFDQENLVKSPECVTLSKFGGARTESAADMAAAVVAGIAQYRFDITLGLDGVVLRLASAAMEPATSTLDLLAQVLLCGPLRLILAVYSRIHYRIVRSIRVGHEDSIDKQE